MASAQPPFSEAARVVISRCRSIARFSDTPGGTTRIFLGEAMHDCHTYLRCWMEDAGMTVRVDQVGNLRGFYPGEIGEAPVFVLGSHLDTVPNAGAFDGVLGVAIAISLVELLEKRRLPFALEVVGFSEEEGIRFGFPFLGSRGWVGPLEDDLLAAKDETGVSVAEAIRNFGLNPRSGKSNAVERRAGFLEFHIEQGPVLDGLDLPLGLVTDIAGQTRASLTFRGSANHAGTTPMHLRKDALAGAASWIAAVEGEARSVAGLVATVGVLQAFPGAPNVIAGEARATLDIRHANDKIRERNAEQLLNRAEALAAARHLTVEYSIRMNQRAVPMNTRLLELLEDALSSIGVPAHHMVSGAGHDAMVVAEHMPAAMIFLRSPGGISHHPAESVRVEDVEAALRVGSAFLERLSVQELDRQ
ncbi:MAG: allantoate amidohydrolase [Bryobacteraceae bacterium]